MMDCSGLRKWMAIADDGGCKMMMMMMMTTTTTTMMMMMPLLCIQVTRSLPRRSQAPAAVKKKKSISRVVQPTRMGDSPTKMEISPSPMSHGF